LVFVSVQAYHPETISSRIASESIHPETISGSGVWEDEKWKKKIVFRKKKDKKSEIDFGIDCFRSSHPEMFSGLIVSDHPIPKKIVQH